MNTINLNIRGGDCDFILHIILISSLNSGSQEFFAFNCYIVKFQPEA